MQSCFNDIYKNKKVLITGHTGFKGTWLALWLKSIGADVIGLSLKPHTAPNMFDLLGLEKDMNHITGDIRDFNLVNEVIKKYQPDFIFHLAAQALVRKSYKEPLLTYETNVMGTLNLLEAARINQTTRVFVNVTSDKCYENKEWDYGYREIDCLGGYDPYSNSKGVSEMVTSSYRSSFFNPKDFDKTHQMALASARAGNVIGGGDWSEDRLIPDCINAVVNNQKISIRNPKAIRPWQLVLEPLSGYLHLGAKMYEDGVNYSGGWNFGPLDESVLKVKDVVSEVIKLWGQGNLVIEPDTSMHEASLLKLDISKATSKLSWKPVCTASEAIKETVNWYQAFYNKENIRKFSLRQLNNYVEKAKSKNIEWSLINEKVPG